MRELSQEIMKSGENDHDCLLSANFQGRTVGAVDKDNEFKGPIET